MIKKLTLFIFSIIGIGMLACKKPFMPAPVTTVTNYLVVEGMINISDSTFIKLSRTTPLSSTAVIKPELKATVSIESNQGGSYTLQEVGNGLYAASSFNLSAANQYRLRIKTSNGSQYVSDFNNTMISPSIDSVTWQAASDLKIAVSTHDPNNATHYYRWDYTEEWEFHSNFSSGWISNGDSILIRQPSQQIWQCYTGDTSHLIALGSSTQLSTDVINKQLLTTIPGDAEKLSLKYSILVKQYALTKDAYDYWTLLQKNTEQLGSIFDSQPSASIGNIHNVNNPAEVVIGFISAGTISSQRIFISKSQLPNWITTPKYAGLACSLDTIYAVNPYPKLYPPWQNQYINYITPQFLGFLFMLIPVQALYAPSGGPTKPYAWLSSQPICVDCTLRGKVVPPSYWK